MKSSEKSIEFSGKNSNRIKLTFLSTIYFLYLKSQILINWTEGLLDLLINYCVPTNWLCHIDKRQSEHKIQGKRTLPILSFNKSNEIQQMQQKDVQWHKLFQTNCVSWNLQNIAYCIQHLCWNFPMFIFKQIVWEILFPDISKTLHKNVYWNFRHVYIRALLKSSTPYFQLAIVTVSFYVINLIPQCRFKR